MNMYTRTMGWMREDAERAKRRAACRSGSHVYGVFRTTLIRRTEAPNEREREKRIVMVPTTFAVGISDHVENGIRRGIHMEYTGPPSFLAAEESRSPFSSPPLPSLGRISRNEREILLVIRA